MASKHPAFLVTPLSGALLLALASPSAAQPSTTLATVTVTAQQAATKVATPAIETPQSVSTISEAQMAQRGVNTVQRATDYTLAYTAIR